MIPLAFLILAPQGPAKVQQPTRPLAAEPRYLDPVASKVTKRALQRYMRLGAVQMLIQRPEGPARAWIDGFKFAESAGGRAWAHRSGTLQLYVSAKGALYQGKAVRAEATEYAAWAGRPVDPLVRSLLVRRNPVRELFEEGQTAKSLGSVILNVRGKRTTCSIVELRSKADRILLTVMPDGLLARVDSEARDGNTVLSQTTRTFSYERIGSVPASAFQLGKPGQKARPLPKLGK